jgi:hypothetical protein
MGIAANSSVELYRRIRNNLVGKSSDLLTDQDDTYIRLEVYYADCFCMIEGTGGVAVS